MTNLMTEEEIPIINNDVAEEQEIRFFEGNDGTISAEI